MSFDVLKRYIENRDIVNFKASADGFLNTDILTQRQPFNSLSLLDHAAAHGILEIVQYLCEKKPELLDAPKDVRSSIAYAACYEQLACLKHLIQSSAGMAFYKRLDHLDSHQKSAIDLALKHKYFECARYLMNSGASLSAENIQALIQIKPFDYRVYCAPSGIYQLLTDDEIVELELPDSLQNSLSISQPSERRKAFKKSLDNKTDLLEIIDKYLYFYHRIEKEKREKQHMPQSPERDKRLEFSQRKRASLLNIIRLLFADRYPFINQASFNSEEDAKKTLSSFLSKHQTCYERYFGGDLSDDSDSEDDIQYRSDQPYQRFDQIQLMQTPEFWLKTKRTTPRNEGFAEKIIDLSKKYPALEEIKKVEEIEKVGIVLTNDLVFRGKIDYIPQLLVLVNMQIENLNSFSSTEDLIRTFAGHKTNVFICGTRGVNYMLDRWNTDARRYHRKMDECSSPQFSEAVLKNLPYDYCTELDQVHDYHQNPEDYALLQTEAQHLHDVLQSLNKESPCIDNSANHKDSPYLFDSVGHCLQDHFSNDLSGHLNDLKEKRERYPESWGSVFKNSLNPRVAIGTRPYHALKYAYGLKAYHSHSMRPRYWNNGKLEYSHVGKVYLSLHSLEEILAENGPNNISMLDRRAQVSIGDLIASEKELSYLGYLPADRIVYQYVAKFPSFQGEWKEIFQIKYGLDRTLYDAFKRFIQITEIDSKEREAIIDLLSEWLCAYHEVQLLEIAKQEAQTRGAILAYLTRDGKLSLEPEKGRIFTKGKGNQDLRNSVHILRELRQIVARKITVFDEKAVPGFRLVSVDLVQSALCELKDDQNSLLQIEKKMTLDNQEKDKKTVIFEEIDNLLKQSIYKQPEPRSQFERQSETFIPSSSSSSSSSSNSGNRYTGSKKNKKRLN